MHTVRTESFRFFNRMRRNNIVPIRYRFGQNAYEVTSREPKEMRPRSRRSYGDKPTTIRKAIVCSLLRSGRCGKTGHQEWWSNRLANRHYCRWRSRPPTATVYARDWYIFCQRQSTAKTRLRRGKKPDRTCWRRHGTTYPVVGARDALTTRVSRYPCGRAAARKPVLAPTSADRG